MYEGTIKREKMLSAFSTMLKPARLITNFSQEELAEKSGLPVELIAGVENGRHRFHEPHYLALAAVFDSTKYTENYNIYRAVLRILTPEDEIVDDTDDFVLVKRWFESFNEANENYNGTEYDDILENLAGKYDIYVDTSAAEDENFPAFVSRLEPLLMQARAKIFVPSTVVSEIEEDIEISDNEREKMDLTEALDYIRTKSAVGVIEIRECLEGFDDTSEVLIALVTDMQSYDKIAIITQDFGLARVMSCQAKVLSAHINDTGDLVLWEENHDE